MTRREYMAEYTSRYYHRRRAWAIERLGGRCVDCGAVESEKPLQFDHKDGSQKLFTLAKGMLSKKEVFVAEVDKCQLRCDDCHIDRHREDARDRSLVRLRNLDGTFASA